LPAAAAPGGNELADAGLAYVIELRDLSLRLAGWDCFDDDSLLVRGRASGLVFTSVRHGVVTAARISGEAAARMLRARAAGLSPERITGHSLCAGHATTGALAGVSLDRIAAQTRHGRRSTLVDRYICPTHALAATSSRDIGL